MNVTETSAEGLKREFKIIVPAGELEDQISRRLGELGRSIRIPGFRPGKVPLNLLRKRYGQAVRGEVLESTVQGSSAEAIREHNLRPALPPKVEILSAAEGADLEYTMSLEVLPEMPEPDFAGLGLEKLAVAVPEEEIDGAVERMAESQRKSEPVERPAENGDIVVADLVGRVGEEEIPGSRGEGREIELGAAGFLPGFTDQLVGSKGGEKRELRVTFPADYGNADLAGKEAVFDVEVKDVRQRLPAAIDDSLAEAVGLENLNELRQEISQRMQRDYDAVARQRLKRALLDKLAERYAFPVPPGMVEMEFNQIWNQYQGEKAAREAMAERAGADDAEKSDEGSDTAEAPVDAAEIIAPEAAALEESAAPPPADEDEEKAKAEYQRIAERRVRLGLLLAEVGRSNNITVTQEELNQALAQEARRHPGYERQVIDYYRNNPDAINNLRAPIFEEKVVDFIVELAKPEERKVTPQELLAGAETDDEDGVEVEPAASAPV